MACLCGWPAASCNTALPGESTHFDPQLVLVLVLVVVLVPWPVDRMFVQQKGRAFARPIRENKFSSWCGAADIRLKTHTEHCIFAPSTGVRLPDFLSPTSHQNW